MFILFGWPFGIDRIFGGSGGSGESIPDLYKQNPDQYYKDQENIGKCKSCDQTYFNNPENINKNPFSQRAYFLIPGNAAKSPRGVEAWMKKLNIPSAVDLSNGGKDLVFYIPRKPGESLSITNGGLSISPSQYPPGTRINALPAGGFSISGTDITGFKDVLFDKKTGTYTIDGATVRVGLAPKEGQKIEAVKDSSGNIKSIKLPAKATYELEDKTSRVLARQALTIYFDGTDPYKLKEAAVSLNPEKIDVNNKAEAYVQRGDLLLFASNGNYNQKTFPGSVPGTINYQDKEGKIITATSAGDLNGFPGLSESIRKKPLSYDPEEGFDRRREISRNIQHLLNANGESLKEDGKFGKKSESALIAFQKKHPELNQIGIVDEETLSALGQNVGTSEFYAREQKERGTWATLAAMRPPEDYYPSPILNPSPSRNDADNSGGFWPVPNQEVFSGWGRPRLYGGHQGIDIEEPVGTPVTAMGDGVVTYTGWKKVHGNVLEIYYPTMKYIDPKSGKEMTGITTRYSHLQNTPDFQMLQPVELGQVVANTGRSGGYNPKKGVDPPYHLHLEIGRGGKPQWGSMDESTRINPKLFKQGRIKYLRQAGS